METYIYVAIFINLKAKKRGFLSKNYKRTIWN